MRYLGVDPGGRRIGLAVGDDATGVVAPLEVIPYLGMEKAVDALMVAAERIGAKSVVVGIPALANGSTGAAARRSQQMAERLRARGLEVILQSEFLSTNEARRRGRETGRARGRPVDDLAAQVLLEEFLAAKGS